MGESGERKGKEKRCNYNLKKIQRNTVLQGHGSDFPECLQIQEVQLHPCHRVSDSRQQSPSALALLVVHRTTGTRHLFSLRVDSSQQEEVLICPLWTQTKPSKCGCSLGSPPLVLRATLEQGGEI